jgi:hypothetical protein
MHRHGRSKHALLCLASFLCRFLHLSTTYELRNFPFYINVREKRKSNKKYGQSRDTGNIVHKIQDGDKHNNEKKTQHRKLKRLATPALQ